VNLFSRLLGPPNEFPLEIRALNTTSLAGATVIIWVVPLYTSVHAPAWFVASIGAVACAQGLAWWLSRVRKAFFPATVVAWVSATAGASLSCAIIGSAGGGLWAFAIIVLLTAMQRTLRGRSVFMLATFAAPVGLLYLESSGVLPILQLSPEGNSWTRYTSPFIALGVVGIVGLVVMRAYHEARDRVQQLLDNVLPPVISARLQDKPGALADPFEEVTVLFADIVGFTEKSAKMPPTELVTMLNGIFTRFDALSAQHGLEKVKTIGDAYMAVAGIPTPREDHAPAAAAMALAMQGAVPEGLKLRIGLHTGPAVAGVIGTRKFAYDLWGDTVNTASRMESHGEPGRIHVSRATHDRLANAFTLTRRGVITVKGKGEMETFFLEGRA
jgi:class 3 adenylate cyclase